MCMFVWYNIVQVYLKFPLILEKTVNEYDLWMEKIFGKHCKYINIQQ